MTRILRSKSLYRITNVIKNTSFAANINDGGFTRVRKGKTEIGKLDFTVLVFTSAVRGSSTGVEDYYYAMCKLPLGGLVTLEIRTIGDAELALRAFKAAIKGFNYTADWPPPNKDSIIVDSREVQTVWTLDMRKNNRKESKNWKQKSMTV